MITVAVALFAWGALSLLKRRQAASAERASRQLNSAPGIPAIVYFWSDRCHVCKNAQKRILEGVLAEYPGQKLTVTSYNVDEMPDIAEEWGVRTLPTTFLLDSKGRIRHVNNGLVAAENLRVQLGPMIS